MNTPLLALSFSRLGSISSAFLSFCQKHFLLLAKNSSDPNFIPEVSDIKKFLGDLRVPEPSSISQITFILFDSTPIDFLTKLVSMFSTDSWMISFLTSAAISDQVRSLLKKTASPIRQMFKELVVTPNPKQRIYMNPHSYLVFNHSGTFLSSFYVLFSIFGHRFVFVSQIDIAQLKVAYPFTPSTLPSRVYFLNSPPIIHSTFKLPQFKLSQWTTFKTDHLYSLPDILFHLQRDARVIIISLYTRQFIYFSMSKFDYLNPRFANWLFSLTPETYYRPDELSRNKKLFLAEDLTTMCDIIRKENLLNSAEPIVFFIDLLMYDEAISKLRLIKNEVEEGDLSIFFSVKEENFESKSKMFCSSLVVDCIELPKFKKFILPYIITGNHIHSQEYLVLTDGQLMDKPCAICVQKRYRKKNSVEKGITAGRYQVVNSGKKSVLQR